MSDSLSRILRTAAQLIAGGLLTEFFLQLSKDVSVSYAPYLLIASTLLVTVCQRIVEDTTGVMLFRPAGEE
jgi:hypothetical protein